MARSGAGTAPCSTPCKRYFLVTIFFFFLLIFTVSGSVFRSHRSSFLGSHGAQRSDEISSGESGRQTAEAKQMFHAEKANKSAWAGKLFNATAHDVPSGFNPVAN